MESHPYITEFYFCFIDTPLDENQQNNEQKEPENNQASGQAEEESGADSEKQDSQMDEEIDPSCIFRKGDGTGRYLIHAAIIYSAYDCLNVSHVR